MNLHRIRAEAYDVLVSDEFDRDDLIDLAMDYVEPTDRNAELLMTSSKGALANAVLTRCGTDDLMGILYGDC